MTALGFAIGFALAIGLRIWWVERITADAVSVADVSGGFRSWRAQGEHHGSE